MLEVLSLMISLVALLFTFDKQSYTRSGPPGLSTFICKTKWNEQTKASDKLIKLTSKCHTPESIAKYIQVEGLTWKRDYNIKEFLSPNQILERGSGVCSAYGRLWAYALGFIGIKADIIAIYANKSAHAITVFLDPNTNKYRLTSNQFLYKIDLGSNREEAITKAASEFYSNWLAIEIYGEDGTLREVIRHNNTDVYPTIEEVEFDIQR